MAYYQSTKAAKKLYSAVEHYDAKKAQEAFDEGASPNDRIYEDMETPLILALYYFGYDHDPEYCSEEWTQEKEDKFYNLMEVLFEQESINPFLKTVEGKDATDMARLSSKKAGDDKVLKYLQNKLKEARFVELKKQSIPKINPEVRMAYAVGRANKIKLEDAANDIDDINAPTCYSPFCYNEGYTPLNYLIEDTLKTDAALFLANHPDLNPFAVNSNDGKNTFDTLKTCYHPEIQARILERAKNGDFDHLAPPNFVAESFVAAFKKWEKDSLDRQSQMSHFNFVMKKRNSYLSPQALMNANDINAQFLVAAKNNDRAGIKKATKHNVDINCKTAETQLTALHLIAANDSVDALEELSENPNVNFLVHDSRKYLPSELADAFKNIELAITLKEKEREQAQREGVNYASLSYSQPIDDLTIYY